MSIYDDIEKSFVKWIKAYREDGADDVDKPNILRIVNEIVHITFNGDREYISDGTREGDLKVLNKYANHFLMPPGVYTAFRRTIGAWNERPVPETSEVVDASQNLFECASGDGCRFVVHHSVNRPIISINMMEPTDGDCWCDNSDCTCSCSDCIGSEEPEDEGDTEVDHCGSYPCCTCVAEDITTELDMASAKRLHSLLGHLIQESGES